MIKVTPFIRSFQVSFSPLKELDLVGYLIHAVPAADMVNGDFTPTIDNLINDGPETSFLYVLPEGITAGMWYVKVAGYDTFGEDVLNYSDPVSVNVVDLQIMPQELDTSMRTDFYIRDVVFLFGTISASGVRSNNTTLYWTVGSTGGYIDRAGETFTLSAGSLANATNSYIIATLVGTSASISKVPFGAGVPTIAANQIIIAITSSTTNSAGNYMAYVRQGNSMMIEGAYIRDATFDVAKVIGTLSAERIKTIGGGVQITDTGITLTQLQAKAALALVTAESAAGAAGTAAGTAAWGSLSGIPDRFAEDTKALPVSSRGFRSTATHLGFYDTLNYPADPWRTYMGMATNSQGTMEYGALYLKGSDPNNSLTWNGSTLTIRGSITADDIKSGGTINGNTLLGYSGTTIAYRIGYAPYYWSSANLPSLAIFDSSPINSTLYGNNVAAAAFKCTGSYPAIYLQSTNCGAIWANTETNGNTIMARNNKGGGNYISSYDSSFTITAAGNTSGGVAGYSHANVGVVGESDLANGVEGKAWAAAQYDFKATGNGINGPFTGAHDGLLSKDIACEVGDILVDASHFWSDNVNNTVSVNSASTTLMQKSVVGVLSGISSGEDLEEITALRKYTGDFYSLYDIYRRIVFNALGEGQINVCKDGGDIEIGDYICSSSRAGKGMKQDDDFLHNYTVAKARENVIWGADEDDIRMIACTYHCG